MAGLVTEFTDKNFQSEVLDSAQPVLVDFWAPWCGPCRMIAPMIEELATEYKGAIKIGKLNIDESPQTPTSYNVSGIPTLLIFKAGQVVSQLVGVQSKTKLQAALNSAKE